MDAQLWTSCGRSAATASRYIAQIEQRERERTGINSLKVKFNNVFGFYIEISKANLHNAPADYERKQTLVGAERFTTPELKEYEAKVLDAEEKIVEIERRLFAELRTRSPPRRGAYGRPRWPWPRSTCCSALRTTPRCEIIAVRKFRWRERRVLEILEGRHPVIEQPELTGSNDRFVPNDLYLNAAKQIDFAHHRTEHGRQIHLPAADRADCA